MRYLFWLALGLLATGLVAIGSAVLLAVSDGPVVDRPATFTPGDIERARSVFDRNDPRRLASGEVATVSIAQADVDLALNYALQRYARASSRVILKQGLAQVTATFRLPDNVLGRYLNIDATLEEGQHLPTIKALRIGRLPLPQALAQWLAVRVLARLPRAADAQFVATMIERLQFHDGRLSAVYRWQAGLPERLRSAAVTPDERERLRQYQVRLAEITRRIPASGGGVPLVDLLQPLLRFAAIRAESGDAIAENRAAIVVLAFHATGKELASLIPEARAWHRPVPRSVMLGARNDLALHFLVSAALAAHAGTSLADAVGVYKELQDARGGSGFSFADLAADRAGTRFGEAAVGGDAESRRLQQRVAAGVRDSDLLPITRDLPEFLQEAEFARRFGSIGSSRYRRMEAEIERRVADLPLYR